MLIDVDDVQPWLEKTKLGLDSNDSLPEEPFWSEFVKSRLSKCGLTVSTWVDTDTTPSLIKAVIGMLVAAQRYNTAYSETDEEAGNPYANKLEERAEMILLGICGGTIDLLDVLEDPADLLQGQPIFYPDDTTGVYENTEDQIRFTMGKVF